MKRAIRTLWVLFVVAMLVPSAWAHLGSKDVYETVNAGPYRLFVTVRPPVVIPGVATVEVRVSGAAADAVRITPIPLSGEASRHPPTSDAMARSEGDRAFFTGGVWMMASGSWQVRFEVDGVGGRQVASVPVPAMALATLHMAPAMGWGLGLLGVFLLVSMAGLVAAAVREARLMPGATPDTARHRRGLAAMMGALGIMGAMVWGGGRWWNAEAASYAEQIYRPLVSEAKLNGDVLDLTVRELPPDKSDPRRHPGRSNADFVLDHGMPIHLYAIRQPEMDAAYHLHPQLVAPGDFRMNLPTMPPGEYMLYGDVVHQSGFPETLVAKLQLPEGLAGTRLGAEDAEAHPRALSAGMLGTTFQLPDGYAMVWDQSGELMANRAYRLRFRLVGPDGKPTAGMEPYLGMAGHAAFVKVDGSVFAHTHPEGSAAMAAMDMANGGMTSMEPVGPEVSFPYGFPTSGRYRIFIQMKHSGIVETGVFDALVH